MHSENDSNVAKPSRLAWLVVALLFPVALLNYLDRQMIASMKSSVIAEIPMTGKRGKAEAKPDNPQSTATTESTETSDPPAQSYVNSNWGQMLGQFKWVYAFFSPIGGFLADRFSRRLTICFSLMIWSIITFITGTVTSYEGLLWTRTLMGVSEAFYIPAALALISDYHLGPTRSKAVGIHQMGIYCGVILGGFSGFAADSEMIGWRGAFMWIGMIGVAYSLPLLVILKDVRNQESGQDRSEVQANNGRSYLYSLVSLITNVSFILLVLYFTLPAMAGWVIRDWMPSHLKDTFPEIGQGLAGVSATIWQVAAIVAAIVGGFLADFWMKSHRRGRIFVSALGMSMMIPALVLVGLATSTNPSLMLAVAALMIFGIGWGFFDCNNMPILCQIVRPNLRATGYGIMNMVSITCGGFADKVFGILKDKQVSMLTTFGLFAMVCLLSVFLVLMIKPKSPEELA